ncbi:zinc finger protein 469 [Ctenodactylus gundi]
MPATLRPRPALSRASLAPEPRELEGSLKTMRAGFPELPPGHWDAGAMPGARPRGAPPPTTTAVLKPCRGTCGLRRPSQPTLQDHAPANRTTQGARGPSSGAEAGEPPKAPPRQADKVDSHTLCLRTQAPKGSQEKASSPCTSPGRSHPQTCTWLVGRKDGSPPQLYSLNISSLMAKPTPDKTPEGPPCPRDPEAKAHCQPSLPTVEASPSPAELCSQRCFQEAPSSFTSTDYTSPNTTPGPPALPRATQSSATSPHGPASYPELPASRASSWPPDGKNNFTGASFRVPPTEGSRPSSPKGAPFQYSFPGQAPQGAGEPFPVGPAKQGYGSRAMGFSFHQSPREWPEAMGSGSTYTLSTPPLPCYPGQSGNIDAPNDPGCPLSPPGAAHSALSPFPNSLHKSLTKVPPEGSHSAHDGLGNLRGPSNPLPQRHFSEQVYGNGGPSPGPVDTKLATSGPPPTRLPQLWNSTAVPYSEHPLGPSGSTGAAFFEGLPQSSPMPWTPVLPSPGPSTLQMEVLSQPAFPRGAAEWQGGSQGTMGACSKMPGPGEKLTAMRTSPGQPGSSPGLYTYGGLKDPGAQTLFFGGTQPQVSPRGAPGLPPPRVLGVSPSDSPLPSPATNTAGSSTCSSLSPLSSSPANPSSEDSQLPGPLGASAFLHPLTRPQDTSSPFPSPEPTHYQPELAKAFSFPTDRLGTEGTFTCLDTATFPDEGPSTGNSRLPGFPREPAPFTAHHFPLSSANLDQLDVLLTCRQCDRNYSSLAAFLGHRQFCSLLLARHGLPGRPIPTATPKAPAHAHPGLLSQGQNVPLLLAGDAQADGKDDPLRTGFPPSLATTPFLLPTSDLDLEDDAKLDSLITEALNGMEDQSDNPEIDSSFIDVFADEDPLGPRGPSTAQIPSTQAGTTPETHSQPLLPAVVATPQPRALCPGDEACPAQNRPKTRSLGLAPMENPTTALERHQRRGKQLKLFQKEVATASGAQGPSRATCPRPKRRSHSTQRAPPRSRSLRTQAKGHTDPNSQVPKVSSCPGEIRSSRHLRLSSRENSGKKRTRGGTWSKELIHKILQQKNKLHWQQVAQAPPQRARPPPSTAQDSHLRDNNQASDSEYECPGQLRPSLRGRSRHRHQQWRPGERRKEDDQARSPGKFLRKEVGKDRVSSSPRQSCDPSHHLDAGDLPSDRDPKCADSSMVAPTHLLQVPNNIMTPEEHQPHLGISQAAKKPETAKESPEDTTKLREVPIPSRASYRKESPRLSAPGPPPQKEDRRNTGRSRPSRSRAHMLPKESASTPGADSLQDTRGSAKPPRPHHRKDSLAHQPGDFPMSAANPLGAAYPEPSIPLLKNSDLGCDTDSLGTPTAKKRPQPNSSRSTLLSRPKDTAGGLPEDLLSKPSAVATPPASSPDLDQSGMDDALEPKPPKSPPHTAETDPGKAQSLLTLESTTLLTELPEEGFDPPLYDSLPANGDSHVLLACADPKKPLMEPLFPPFLLLEEVAPVLPSQLPDLPGAKACSKPHPHAGRVSPSLPPVPRKGGKNSAVLLSNASEDELEIKRLVTELESQLQRRQGIQGAPQDLSKATGAASPGPQPGSLVPTLQASPGDTCSAANFTGSGRSHPHQEGAETTMCLRKACLESRQEKHPGPREASPPPGPCRERVKKARVSKMEADSRDPPEASLPDRREQLEPLLEARDLEKHSPNCKLLLPKSMEAARTQENDGTPLLLSYEQGREYALEPHPMQEVVHSPIAPLAPDLASLEATPSPGASHRCASKAPIPQGSGILHPIAEGPGLQGSKPAPVRASPLTALQGREALFYSGLQDLVSNSVRPPQDLGNGSEDQEDAQASWWPPPVSTQSPQLKDPPDPGRDRVKDGSLEVMQITADPIVVDDPLGPTADGHWGLPGQTKKFKGQGKASKLQSEAWKSPEAPDNLIMADVLPETLLVSLARVEGGPQGAMADVNLQQPAQLAPSPTAPEGKLSESAAHMKQGPKDRSPGKVASPGPDSQLLLDRKSPAPRDLANCAPRATPASCSLKHHPQKDPPSIPSGVMGSQGEPQELLPTSSIYLDPPNSPRQPAHPAHVSPGQAGNAQASIDAGAGRHLAAPPPLTTSLCGPKKILPLPLLGTSSPSEDYSSGQLSHTDVLTSNHEGDGPSGSTLQALKNCKKEGQRGFPASTTPPCPRRPISLRVTTKISGLSGMLTEQDTEAVRELQAPEPHSSLDGVSQGPSSHTQSSNPCCSQREGQGVTDTPTNPAMEEGTVPDSHSCLERETGSGTEGWEDAKMSAAKQSGVTKVPRASAQGLAITCSPAGLCLALATSPSNTAGETGSYSPESHIRIPYQTPQKDLFSSQDPKQTAHSIKKPEPMEKGPWKGGASSGASMTCEICSASFRSKPGLSRHKARKHRVHGTSQLRPKAMPAPQALELTALTCGMRGKKNRKLPGKERPSSSPTGPGHAAEPPTVQGSTAPGDTLGSKMGKEARMRPKTPDSALGQPPYPASLVESGEGKQTPASKPRRPDGEVNKPHSKQADGREGQGQSGEHRDNPCTTARPSTEKVGMPRARRPRAGHILHISADVTSDAHLSSSPTVVANDPAPQSHCLTPEGLREAGGNQLPPSATPGPGMGIRTGIGLEGLRAEDMASQTSPRGRGVPGGRVDGASPGGLQERQKGSLARQLGEPRAARASGKGPTWAIGDKSTEDSRGAKGGLSDCKEGTLNSPEVPSSEADSTTSDCPRVLLDLPEAQGGVQGPDAHNPEAPTSGLGDPPSLFDDDLSFSQLFPPDGRFAQKKNPRVYRKRCGRMRCPRPTEPHPHVVGDSIPNAPTQLPTDLSDSGSLCLSSEDLWDDKTPDLPESFLLEGFLNSSAPGVDPWAPSHDLWALELGQGASCKDKVPSCCSQDDQAEAIPELHMVPAAWRGLGLQVATDEESSPLRDMSPEPPNLEREPYDGRLPGSTGLLPLHAKDMETPSTALNLSELCFLGPCEDLAVVPTTSLSDPAAGPGPAVGRDQPARGGKASSFKCRVCFRRFHGLGELDLHKLAHSAAPPPTCYMCVERRFSSRQLLREHLQEKHVQGQPGPWACGMCLQEVADIWMYNQHLREHAARFARKGQAQRAPPGDLPEGSQGDSAVTPFRNPVVVRARKPHRGRHSEGRAGKSPRDASGRKGGAQAARDRAEHRVQAPSTCPDGAFMPPSEPASGDSPTPLAGPFKATSSPSPDPWSPSEPLLHATRVHADCKDPSRDCHHCGKRFPKPFKLQRHLAVHSPRRVFLCPRCPGVYAEPGELRGHLRAAHHAAEAREPPPTPLYTCELCADVLHVIRRSFACSACHYTFAKKEQFERHMEKHLRGGPRPCVLRAVRRPGAPEGSRPSKRRRVGASSGGQALGANRPLSSCSLHGLQADPNTSEAQSPSQERPENPADHQVREEDPPPPLSPFPAALAEGRNGHRLDTGPERQEEEALPGSPGSGRKQQPHRISGTSRIPGVCGKGTSGQSLENPSPLPKEKQASSCLTVLEVETGVPSQEDSASKPEACGSSSRNRCAASSPSRMPKVPGPLRKSQETGSLAPEELTHSPEAGVKPTTPKAKPRPSSQSNGGARLSTKKAGGSQPQPSSGQLQSETASTPAKPSQNPTPDQPLPRTPARGCPQGKAEGSEKRGKGQATGLARWASMGSPGRSPSAPDKPARPPRKQATPSRVLPAKLKPSSPSSKMRPQPWAQQKGGPGHIPLREALSKACPQPRPPTRAPKRGRAVPSAEPRDHRTAESQSHLLSQLFGQRLTSFKIPLKKDTCE